MTIISLKFFYQNQSIKLVSLETLGLGDNFFVTICQLTLQFITIKKQGLM